MLHREVDFCGALHATAKLLLSSPPFHRRPERNGKLSAPINRDMDTPPSYYDLILSTSGTFATQRQTQIDETIADIKTLVGKGSTIDTCFTEIIRDISKTHLDDEQLVKYHKEYIELLWKSRDIAGRAQAAAADLSGDVFTLLLDQSIQPSVKIDELSACMVGWEIGASDASSQSHSFDALCGKLEEFANAFSRTAQSAKDTNSAETEQLSVEIAKADADIERLETDLVNTILKWKPIIGGAFRGLLSLSLHTAFNAIHEAIAQGATELQSLRELFFGKTEERHAMEANRDQMKAELAARLDALHEVTDKAACIPERIRNLEDEIKGFAVRLTIFTHVFQELTNGSADLIHHLESPTADITFYAEVHIFCGFLKRLALALAIYAKVQENPGGA